MNDETLMSLLNEGSTTEIIQQFEEEGIETKLQAVKRLQGLLYISPKTNSLIEPDTLNAMISSTFQTRVTIEKIYKYFQNKEKNEKI